MKPKTVEVVAVHATRINGREFAAGEKTRVDEKMALYLGKTGDVDIVQETPAPTAPAAAAPVQKAPAPAKFDPPKSGD
jgi:hypothetical protein